MRVAVYLPLLGSLVFALTGPWLARRRLAPAAGVWLLTVGAALCAAATAWSLALLAATLVDDALPGSFHAIGLYPTARIVMPTRGGSFPADDLIGLAALGLLAAGAVRLALVLRHDRSLRHDLDLLCAGRPAGLVVVADPQPLAFAVPAARWARHGEDRRTGHIVVSSGMLGALTGPQRRVLIAHERAHLAAAHGRHSAVVGAAVALVPLLRPVAAAGGYLRERWADEVAADAVGDRLLAATALARAALAASGSRTPPAALAYQETGVAARVSALRRPPARTLPVTLVAALLCCGAAALAAVEVEATRDFVRLMLPFI